MDKIVTNRKVQKREATKRKKKPRNGGQYGVLSKLWEIINTKKEREDKKVSVLEMWI